MEWNKTHIYIRSFFAVKTGKEIIGNDRYLNKMKKDSQKFNFLYYYKLYNIYLNVSTWTNSFHLNFWVLTLTAAGLT